MPRKRILKPRLPVKAYYTPEFRERFWANVDRRGPADCWHWIPSKESGDYGRIRVKRSMMKAHRASWEMENEEHLGERFACHHCDVRSCVNPDHIYAGDAASNNNDTVNRGRRKFADFAGAKNPRAKISDEDVTRIRERIDAGETNKSIAEDYPISHSMVSKIRTGSGWHAGGTNRDSANKNANVVVRGGSK